MAFLERAERVEPPPELVTRILFDPPWAQGRARAAAGLRGRLEAIFQPVLQPRFAMGMAMTILSFAMLARFVAPARQLRPADLAPAKVWAGLEDRVYRGWQRTVKFYESIKVVYQIQSKLRDWQQQQEEEQKPAVETGKSGSNNADEHRLPVNGSGEPKSR